MVKALPHEDFGLLEMEDTYKDSDTQFKPPELQHLIKTPAVTNNNTIMMAKLHFILSVPV